MSSRSKKITITLAILLALSAIAVGAFLIIKKRQDQNQNQNQGQNQQTSQQTEQNQTKTDAEKTDTEQPTIDTNPVQSDPKQQTQNEGTDPNQSASITGALTRADVVNGKLILRVNIDQYLSNGICTLTLTSDSGKTYTDAVNITDSASTSTCEGFDIPTSSLEKGSWDISIKITSNDKTGTIAGKATV